MHFNVELLKKLGTFGLRIPINIESNEIAKNKDCFFPVNKICHFIRSGKTRKMKIKF